MSLPNELWLMIIDILGKSGELRAMFNLKKALGSEWKNVGNVYFTIELIKERNRYIKDDYHKKMFDFWKRTGIDDGMSQKDVFNAIKEKKLIYKTIWACNIYHIKQKETSIISNSEYFHNEKINYTYKIIRDRRFFYNEKILYGNPVFFEGDIIIEKKIFKRFIKEIGLDDENKSLENYYKDYYKS